MRERILATDRLPTWDEIILVVLVEREGTLTTNRLPTGLGIPLDRVREKGRVATDRLPTRLYL